MSTYLIPESFNDSSVRLYRASSFPTNWELVGRLISGRPYVDPSIIYHDNTWWMFVANVFNNDTLYLFYADTLTGPWVEHPSSPIVTGNANIARPGGRVTDFNGRLLRFAQDDAPTYGNQVRAFEILDLTRTSYLEAEVIESPVLSASGNGWNAYGMHQLDPVEVSPGNWLAVTDGFGDSYYWDDGLPQSGWSVEYVDSEELVGEDGAAANAFDGDPSTLWVTQWYGGSPAHPHELQISLGGLYEVSGLLYLPRQDGGDNGRIRQYEIYVSTDGVSWGSLVASGIFPDTAAGQEVLFAPVPATHVRLVALNAYDGDPWTAVAELNVIGNAAGGNLSPDGVIDTPAGDLTIAVGESVDFGGTGTDPENDLPLSYRWSFGAGSGLSDVTVEDPGPVQFNTAGSFSVSFTVTDANGLADPTPAVRLVTVTDGTVAAPLPQSGWSVEYVDSEELVGEDGAAANAFDGDPSTLWVTQWYGGSPAHPHELQISLGGLYEVSGLLYLPRQDGGDNGRIRQYEIYVSTDGVSWAAWWPAGSSRTRPPGRRCCLHRCRPPTCGRSHSMPMTGIPGRQWRSST